MARKGGMKSNVFVKPNEQNDARINSAMAKKGRMKSNVFVKPNEQNDARINSVMARKGGMKSNVICKELRWQIAETTLRERRFDYGGLSL